jgi:restriction system protein
MIEKQPVAGRRFAVPIPDFQTLMLPLLTTAADGGEHGLAETSEHLAAQFALTEEEKREVVAPGKPTKLRNRVAWAFVHLRRAGVVQETGKGRFRITERGRELLRNAPPRLSVRLLMQLPGSAPHPQGLQGPPEEPTQTPQELLESSYKALRRQLADDLLDRIRNCSPAFFEKLVVDLLLAMGYGGSWEDAGQAVGQASDGGIDGIIQEDKLGLEVLYIQAKRWEGTVGRPVVQAFAGSLEGHRAKKGVLITTSQFSQEATDYVRRIEKKIVLIDGKRLAELMIDHDIGVTEVAAYSVKRVNSDYFEEE